MGHLLVNLFSFAIDRGQPAANSASWACMAIRATRVAFKVPHSLRFE